jgi:hypothetical protein
MKQNFKLAAISVALIMSFGAAHAQNMPSPKPEDAEKDAFQTPTVGKDAAPVDAKDRHPDRNPESRLNDDRQPPEQAGAPKPTTPPK